MTQVGTFEVAIDGDAQHYLALRQLLVEEHPGIEYIWQADGSAGLGPAPSCAGPGGLIINASWEALVAAVAEFRLRFPTVRVVYQPFKGQHRQP